MDNAMRRSWPRLLWCVVAIGWGAALPAAQESPPAAPVAPMTLDEARTILADGNLERALGVAHAAATGALAAGPAETTEVLLQLYRLARSSGGDRLEYAGGAPPLHSEIEIAVIDRLSEEPLELSRDAVSEVVRTYVEDRERLAPERTHRSPLKALEPAMARLLLADLSDAAIAELADRFVDSPAIPEEAKCDLAIEVLRRRIARAQPPGKETGSLPASIRGRLADIVVQSFATAAMPDIRQHGRRVEVAREIVDGILGDDIAPLDAALSWERAAAPAERYFAATVVASALKQRVAAGKPLDREDRARLRAVAGIARDARQRYGAGAHGNKPLERALAELSATLPAGATRQELRSALGGR